VVRGVGVEVASRLAERRATVCAGARDTDDVTDDEAVTRVESEPGRLGVLVTDAGVGGPESPLHERPVEGIDGTLVMHPLDRRW
jgi:NAD(P)-dependent dehydrogenase (short-subunit alcohol dehydrogenase family)